MFGKYTIVVCAHILLIQLILKAVSVIFQEYYSFIVGYIGAVLALVVVSCLTFDKTKSKFLSERVPPANKAVFITGCDSGFGHLLAKRLDSKGFHVFAGCLMPEGNGASELKSSCSQCLRVVPLDVTQNESVLNALTYVKEHLGSSVLWAVVNNAGILYDMSVDLSPIESFEKHMDVNCIGQVRVTKAFLPLLKRSKGRIVNVTSIVGYSAVPLLAPYTTSKFAAAGFTECLRHELKDWGISVSTIEPEIFNTPMADKGRISSFIDKMVLSLDSETKAAYGQDYLDSLNKNKDWILYIASNNVELVVNDMESAVSSVYPESRYKPRRNIFFRFLCFLIQIAPFDWQAHISHVVVSFLFKKPQSAL